MHLGGVSLATLTRVNLALVHVTLALILIVVRRWSTPLATAAAGGVFVTTFAFGQYTTSGNYNYIAPYSHELTHGLLLALGMLAALAQFGRRGARLWSVVAGIALGLVLLTKAELWVAAAGAAGVRLALAGDRRAAALFGLGAALPPLAAFGCLIPSLGATQAWRAVLGSWVYLGEKSPTRLAFYKHLLGIDTPGRNLLLVGLWAGGSVASLWAIARLLRRLPPLRTRRKGPCLAALAAGFALMAGCSWFLHWNELARPLPLYAASVALLAGLRARRTHSGAAADQAAFALFATLLLLKVALAVSWRGYGFVLALPSTLLVVTWLIDAFPRWSHRSGEALLPARMLGLGVVLAFVAIRLEASHGRFASRPAAIEMHGERIRSGPRAEALQAALHDLDARLTPQGTLFVLPEGVMLNFLLRRRNPTPYINFMPPELLFWGEEAVIEALEHHPPDAVALVHRDTRADYGTSFFGDEGFGERILTWVRAHYRVAARFGRPPLQQDYAFGVEILVPRRAP